VDGRTAAGQLSRERAPRVSLGSARPEDAAAIAALLGVAMPGALRLALAEAAAGCAPRESSELRHHAVVARGPDSSVLAHGARTVRRLRLGGGIHWVGYLHGLRRADALAGEGRLLARALTHLRETRRDDEVDHDLTAILTGNHRARRVLEGGLPGAPAYRFIGGYRTSIVCARVAARWRTHAVVRQLPIEAVAQAQELVDRQAGDYAPAAVVDATWLSAWLGDRLAGVVHLVDRRDDRRERIVGYTPWLRWLRPLANAGLGCAGMPTLPRAPAEIDLVYAAYLTVVAGGADTVRALVAGIARAANARLIALGHGAAHPLAEAVAALPAWRIDSRLYAVGERPMPCDASPEAAWL
jgi:hypothetical protein